MKTEIIVALDYNDLKDVHALTKRLGRSVLFYKVGLRLFTAHHEAAVKAVEDAGGKVFLDLKFHDIPQTVAHAVEESARLGVYSASLHLAGGREMLKAAAAAKGQVRLWGISILTSLSADDLAVVGLHHPETAVPELAKLGVACGIDGVVCSGDEADLVAALKPRPQIIVPGVRPAGEAVHDQKRVVTPAEASARGADFIVVGRPITGAKDPKGAVEKIREELEEARKVHK